MRARRLYLEVLFLIAVSIASPRRSQAARTDILVLDNGDRITGEILSLQLGKLSFKTDNIGTLSVEWRHVAQLQSVNHFTLLTGRGDIYFGSLAETTEPQLEIVDDDLAVVTVAIDSVVSIDRVKPSFWTRLDGSIDFGFSYTQQNQSSQFNLGMSVRETTEKRQIRIDLDSLFSAQQGADDTTRNTVSGQMYRRFEGRWFYLGAASVEQNNGLDLDLRTLFGGGIGRELYHSNSALFLVLSGLDVNRELYTFNVDPVTSLEAIVGVEYSNFAFDGLTREVTSRFAVRPSLTQSGRVRLQFDTSFRQNIIGNLYWNVDLFETYDSQPPQPDAPKNDFGITTSLGWSF